MQRRMSDRLKRCQSCQALPVVPSTVNRLRHCQGPLVGQAKVCAMNMILRSMRVACHPGARCERDTCDMCGEQGQ